MRDDAIAVALYNTIISPSSERDWRIMFIFIHISGCLAEKPTDMDLNNTEKRNKLNGRVTWKRTRARITLLLGLLVERQALLPQIRSHCPCAGIANCF